MPSNSTAINPSIPRSLNLIPQQRGGQSVGQLAGELEDKLDLARSSNRNKDTGKAKHKECSSSSDCGKAAPDAGLKAPVGQGFALQQVAPISQVDQVGQLGQVSQVSQAGGKAFDVAQTGQITYASVPPIAAGGQTFSYALPPTQVPSNSHNVVLEVPFKIGGNHHVIQAGGLGIANAHNFTIVPKAEVVDDTYEIIPPSAIGDGRGAATVSQQPVTISRAVYGGKELGLKEAGFKDSGFPAQGATQQGAGQFETATGADTTQTEQGGYGRQGPLGKGGKGNKGNTTTDGTGETETTPAPEPVETEPAPDSEGTETAEPIEPAPPSTTFHAFR